MRISPVVAREITFHRRMARKAESPRQRSTDDVRLIQGAKTRLHPAAGNPRPRSAQTPAGKPDVVRARAVVDLGPFDAHADVNGDGVLEHVPRAAAWALASPRRAFDLPGHKTGVKMEKTKRKSTAPRVLGRCPPARRRAESKVRGLHLPASMVVQPARAPRRLVADANAGAFITEHRGRRVGVARRRRARRSRRCSRRGGPSGFTASRRDERTRTVLGLDSVRLDLVFLNSRGEMTSYTHEGTRRWQLRTDSGSLRGRGETPGLFAFLSAEEPWRNLGGTSRDVLHSETEVALAVGATRATFVPRAGTCWPL